MKKSKFQTTTYALLMYAANGHKITGTGSPGDLEHAKSQAHSLLRLNPQAAYVDVKPFVKGQDLAQVDALARIEQETQS
jgi:hypothetical protein